MEKKKKKKQQVWQLEERMSKALSGRRELSIRVNKRYLEGAEHFPAFKTFKNRKKKKKKSVAMAIVSGSHMSL